MNARAAALLLATTFAVGCGDSSTKPATPLPEVKGAPMRHEPAKDLSPEAATAGDLSRAAAVNPPPPVVPAPTPATPAAATPAAATPSAAGDFHSTTFDELSGFDYALYSSDAAVKHEIPAKILALSGKKIAVDGYMMPLKYEAGGAKKFILMKNQFGCCYGGTPKLNEWIEVTMEGGAVAEYQQHVLITAFGVLDVKEEQKDGFATSLYKMRGERTEFTEAK